MFKGCPPPPSVYNRNVSSSRFYYIICGQIRAYIAPKNFQNLDLDILTQKSYKSRRMSKKRASKKFPQKFTGFRRQHDKKNKKLHSGVMGKNK